VIEDGAYFKGNIDIVRQDAARPATSTLAPAPAAAAPSTPAQKPAAPAPGGSSQSAAAAGAADGKR